jgi:MSHA biogenesis protein MshJ
LQYLTEVEQLPTQMYWGKAEMKVETYPSVVLTVTVYTLSMEKTWLKI